MMVIRTRYSDANLSGKGNRHARHLLRARSRTIAADMRVRADGVVPIAVEFMTMNVDGVHLGISDFDAGGVGVGIDLALDLQAGICGRGRDQLNDGLVADQRAPAPVLRDEGEQAMLDLVPFAGAGRQMAYRDRDAEFIGEGLQFAL